MPVIGEDNLHLPVPCLFSGWRPDTLGVVRLDMSEHVRNIELRLVATLFTVTL